MNLQADYTFSYEWFHTRFDTKVKSKRRKVAYSYNNLEGNASSSS